MGTSLAPSPIDSVILFSLVLTILTTSAFWMGNSLQHTTAWQYFARLANSISFYSLPIMGVKSSPSINKPFDLGLSPSESSFALLLSYLSVCKMFLRSGQVYLSISKWLCIRLQLLAIFSAVSILSPVSIQILMSTL